MVYKLKIIYKLDIDKIKDFYNLTHFNPLNDLFIKEILIDGGIDNDNSI